MMPDFLLDHARLLSGDGFRPGALLVGDGRIRAVMGTEEAAQYRRDKPETPAVDLGGDVLMAGGVDMHVHFREPGMTQKADLESESRAALLGGVTSFADMPNTLPPTLDEAALRDKRERAQGRAHANYGFHLGASDGNADEIERLCQEKPGLFGGVKIFLGSSTGRLLVSREDCLERLFQIKGKVIMVHAEEESLIQEGLQAARDRYGEEVPFREHPHIRSREACIEATKHALDLAVRYGTRLHLLHISTEEELELIQAAKKRNPGITAETTPNYLWFDDSAYDSLKGRIKCNPAIKSKRDRLALLDGLRDGVIDTLGTDHAPHLAAEKDRPYLQCPSGMPTLQQSLSVLWTLAAQHRIPPERLAAVWSENAARIFGLKGRGVLQPGAWADLVSVRPQARFTVRSEAAPRHGDSPSSSAWTDSRCGWTPYEGVTLQGAVTGVWLNGRQAVTKALPAENLPVGMALEFK